jgi:nucleoside-diphosphate-sugar epimerase
MIIGNGLIANGMRSIDNDSVVFFCSGVSDSSKSLSIDFNREKELYKSIPKDKKVIYFSTISVCDENDKKPYVNHKRDMEQLVMKNQCLIFRITQVLGTTGNENNIVNYFVNKTKQQQEIVIQKNVRRSIVDIEDVTKLVLRNIDKTNEIINFVGYEVLYVTELIELIFNCLNLKTNVVVENGIENYIPESDLKIEGYTKGVLKKYINGY